MSSVTSGKSYSLPSLSSPICEMGMKMAALLLWCCGVNVIMGFPHEVGCKHERPLFNTLVCSVLPRTGP